ncbi:MAG: DNA topoisomerase IV subunit B, partial [Kofleriaceae bacterium]|nr:DNA topoisomerase IV subunit B [Kofleriaceae bacterium]
MPSSGSEITVLSGLEPVRKRPQMYIEGLDQRGLNHLVTGVVGNSVAEISAGHASRIELSVGLDSLTVEDDGQGIPVDLLPYGI